MAIVFDADYQSESESAPALTPLRQQKHQLQHQIHQLRESVLRLLSDRQAALDRSDTASVLDSSQKLGVILCRLAILESDFRQLTLACIAEVRPHLRVV